MTIGQNIRHHRKEMDIKQDELAKMVGTSTTAVSLWERDIWYPSMISLICLADTFGLTLDELVGRTFKKAEGG